VKEKKFVLHEMVRVNGMGKSYIKRATLRFIVTTTQKPDQELKDLIAKVWRRLITTGINPPSCHGYCSSM
jgi:hypothetical protein